MPVAERASIGREEKFLGEDKVVSDECYAVDFGFVLAGIDGSRIIAGIDIPQDQVSDEAKLTDMFTESV